MSLEAKDLSKVGFTDYFRLRRQLELTGDTPNSQIQQHDNDPVTFDEAYETLSLIINDLANSGSFYARVSVDTLGTLITLLVSKNVLNEKDYALLLKEAKEIMKMDKDDETNEDNWIN